MRFSLFLLIVILYSCVDNRELSTEDSIVNPEYQLNFINLRLSAREFNSGNFSVPDQIKDTTEIDFLRKDINTDYLETVSFQIYAENTINQPIEIDFKFFNPDDEVVYRYTKTINSLANAAYKEEFLVDLTTSEVIDIKNAVYLETIFVQQEQNDLEGEFLLRSVVQFSYKYTL